MTMTHSSRFCRDFFSSLHRLYQSYRIKKSLEIPLLLIENHQTVHTKNSE